MGAVSLVGRALVRVLLESCTKVATELSSFTPEWSHIVDDKSYKKALARKHLLGHASRPLMNEKAQQLNGMMVQCGNMFKTVGLGELVKDDPEFADQIVHVNGIFGKARKAISINAALNVIIELTGQQQIERASFVYTNQRDDLPGSLTEELNNIVKKASSK